MCFILRNLCVKTGLMKSIKEEILAIRSHCIEVRVLRGREFILYQNSPPPNRSPGSIILPTPFTSSFVLPLSTPARSPPSSSSITHSHPTSVLVSHLFPLLILGRRILEVASVRFQVSCVPACLITTFPFTFQNKKSLLGELPGVLVFHPDRFSSFVIYI